MTFTEARQKRNEARGSVQSGADPAHARKMEKIVKRINADNSFKSVVDDFIQVRLVNSGKSEGTISKARWFVSLLEPSFGAPPIADIQPAELLDVLRRIEKKGHRETARHHLSASRHFQSLGTR